MVLRKIFLALVVVVVSALSLPLGKTPKESEKTSSPHPHIHCYCNTKQCFPDSSSKPTTCISKARKCFIRTLHRQKQAEHGCVDQLPKTMRGLCQFDGDVFRRLVDSKGIERGVIMCCSENNCNKATQLPDETIKEAANFTQKEPQLPTTTTEHDKELWFTLTMVIVPACGMLILLVIVVIAFRLLHGGNRDRQVSRASAQKPCWEKNTLRPLFSDGKVLRTTTVAFR